MRVQCIPMWRGSSDNYAYLIIDDESKDAVIIDPANPIEVAPILNEAIRANGIHLVAILNTHHHWDHAGGNQKLRIILGLPNLDIIGGSECEGVTKTPGHGETFILGTISIRSIHTPCHTQDSICFFAQDGDQKAVFTGDTLFTAGCGRFFEGSAADMHEALNRRLAILSDDTVVYSGHEYTRANAKFALSILQSQPIRNLLDFAEKNQVTTGKFTIGDEKQHNIFMMAEIQKVTSETDPVKIISKLRELKNKFADRDLKL